MIWRVIPQPTEWERIGNQIDAAMIFAQADLVNVQFATQSVSLCAPMKC
jgi:hypothetical protein